MSVIKKIENWYQTQCDGNWEHDYGIEIESLDNPGWHVKICLIDTNLENVSMERQKIDRTENNWLHWRVEESYFIGDGGPGNLEEVLEKFLDLLTDPM